MIMRMATAAAFSLLLAGTALAQAPAAPASGADTPAATTAPAPGAASTAGTADTPQTADACIAAAAELGEVAEGKGLADDKLEKLDQLFSRLEALCDGQQFKEAMAVAGDIRTLLDGN
jgi:hypothetical protein